MSNVRRPPRYAEPLLVAAFLVLAVVARAVGWHVRTGDMDIFVMWYHQLGAAGAWHGLGKEIGNYNAPFMYLLAVAHFLPGPVVVKIKAIFVLFDAVLALFAYLIAKEHFPGRRIPVAAAVAMLLLPTVVINASLYGQMDAMWACFALGGVYFLLREKWWPAVALCAVSLAVKPQGIFIFPLLLLLALAGRLPWRMFLAVPAVFLALDLPALLAGRDPVDLLTIYDLDRQARNVPYLTFRAPSLYAFIPAGDLAGTVRTLGYVFTAVAVLAVCYILIIRNVRLDRRVTVTAAALFSIMMPFLLPGMHERYFFLADVLTVVLACYRPRLWYVPLLVQASSLLSYEPYLFGGRNDSMLPLVVPATLMLAALVVVGHRLIADAFTDEAIPAKFWDELGPPEDLSPPPEARPAPLPARRA